MDQESKGDKDTNPPYNEALSYTTRFENPPVENLNDNGVEASSTCSSLQPASACTSRTTSLGSEGDKTEKLLKILQFRNPGPQLASFDPDKSRREQRKVKQFVKTTEQSLSTEKHDQGRRRRERTERRPRKPPKRRNYHDRSGIRLLDNKDVCDCQDLNCPGCHFPCNSCGSEKCGIECRCSRKWTYETHVEIENPLSPRTIPAV